MFDLIKTFLSRLRPIEPLYVAYDSGNKSKPTLVLLHGIAATSMTWKYLIDEIDKDEYRLIVMDLLGSGKSPKPRNVKYTVDDHVRYVKKTLKKLDIEEPFAIVGHSMGGIIAANYCVKYSHQVDQLFLLSPPVYFKDTSDHKIISQKQTDLYMKIYKYLCENKDFTLKHSARIRKLLKLIDGIDVNEDNWDCFRLSLMNTIVNQDFYSDIKKISVPIHIIYGLFDEVLVKESVNRLAKLNHVDIVKVSAADHILSSKFAREVARRIENTY